MNKIVIMIFLTIFNLSYVLNVNAETIPNSEKVIVLGLGEDQVSAHKNALRNAVEQVVGTYVKSDTMVQNSALINDEILTHSAGYVKASKILSVNKNNDSIEVKIEAYVVTTKLVSKIKELNIAMRDVDGDSLFGEAITRYASTKSGGELLNSVLSKFPQSAYIIKIGKPQIESVDNANSARIRLRLSVSFDSNFIVELETALKQMATEFIPNMDISVDSSSTGPYNKIVATSRKQGRLLLLVTSNNQFTRDIASSAYVIDNISSIVSDKNSALTNLSNITRLKAPNVLLEFIDVNNSVISSVKLKLKDTVKNYNQSGSSWTRAFAFNSNSGYNSPLVMQSLYGFTNIGNTTLADIIFVKDKIVDFDIVFDEDMLTLKNTKSLRSTFVSYYDNPS